MNAGIPQATKSKLAQLRSMTVVVADTGDFTQIERFRPEDATTNPSLLLKVASLPEFDETIAQALRDARGADTFAKTQDAMDRFAVGTGTRILKLIPGRVSTEVDARLSFDTAATIERAERIIDLYQQAGISRERVLIKIASTWEGIRAAELLERKDIHCNLTLLFGFTQAVACAEAGVTLISPFVGRILDWHKKATGQDHFAPAADPGVISVTRIYNYYKQHNYPTIVMGASFRNCGEIEQLAGCDRLTISPQLLEELDEDPNPLIRQLDAQQVDSKAPPTQKLDEAAFRWAMNDDAMATEKLAEGIRNFSADAVKLESILQRRLA